jgi:predicted anti-sigma-YlaC factor YlaD
MQCQDLIRYLSDYIDQNLDKTLMAEAREHLATCQNCHVVLDSTQQTILLYRQAGHKHSLPPKRHQVLYAQLTRALAERDDDCEP